MFDGNSGVPSVTKWLAKCTRVFDLLTLVYIPQRELATHNASGVAIIWCHVIEDSVEVETYSWELFKVAFQSKFVLGVITSALME